MLAAACNGGAGGGADGGVDATEADGATPVQAPDLRFKWVGAGLPLHADGFSNGGTMAGGTFTLSGPVGVTPLQLTGEVDSTYEVFSAGNLEPMKVTATSAALPGIDADLGQLLDPHTIVVGLDSSLDPNPPSTPAGIYNALMNGTQGGVTYLPVIRTASTIADFPGWVAAQGASGNVVTAFCPKDGGLYALAFGHTGDDTTYETQVVTAALDELVSKLDSLASSGYVITALGRDGSGIDGAGGFIAVGTRPAGKAAVAHTLKSIDEACLTGSGTPTQPFQSLFDDGYAVLGAIFHDPSDACTGEPAWLYIAEK